MPDVPADHVGDGERALDERADGVALRDVLPPTRLGATRTSAAYWPIDLGRARSAVYGSITTRRTSCAPRLRALGADHEPVLPGEHEPASSRKTCAGPLVDRALGELARLVEHADESVATTHPPSRRERRPPLRELDQRRRRAHRAAGRPSAAPRCSASSRSTSSSPISVSPPTSAGGAIEPAAACRRRSRGRTTAGCRRRTRRPRSETRRCRARGSGVASGAARRSRCGPGAGPRPRRRCSQPRSRSLAHSCTSAPCSPGSQRADYIQSPVSAVSGRRDRLP